MSDSKYAGGPLGLSTTFIDNIDNRLKVAEANLRAYVGKVCQGEKFDFRRKDDAWFLGLGKTVEFVQIQHNGLPVADFGYRVDKPGPLEEKETSFSEVYSTSGKINVNGAKGHSIPAFVLDRTKDYWDRVFIESKISAIAQGKPIPEKQDEFSFGHKKYSD